MLEGRRSAGSKARVEIEARGGQRRGEDKGRELA
jgi:hypothetical protein